MKNEIQISPYGNLLVYKEGYTLEFVRSTIQKRKLNGLRIFAVLSDQKLSSLNFLAKYTFLESLSITSSDDHDLSFLTELRQLKELSIASEGKNIIDLSNQLNLEDLSIQWRKGKVYGLEKCQNLKTLYLIDFKENDFSAISQLTGLEKLVVKTASIKSVTGIQNFSSLESLSLGNCRMLKSIADIPSLQKLKLLEIDLCAHIEDYTFIGSLINLVTLRLTDCKGISSIKFIESLPALNRLALLGNTDVLDGDMTPAKNVNEVFYKHRKHYNVKIETKKQDALVKSNLEKIKGLFGIK